MNRRERNKTHGGEVADFTRKTFEIPMKQLPREQPHNKGNNCQAEGKHWGRIWSVLSIGEIGHCSTGALAGSCDRDMQGDRGMQGSMDMQGDMKGTGECRRTGKCRVTGKCRGQGNAGGQGDAE